MRGSTPRWHQRPTTKKTSKTNSAAGYFRQFTLVLIVLIVLIDFGVRTDGRSDGRLGGDLRVRTPMRPGPVWTVLAVILVDSGRLGGDLRVRRVRSGPVWTVLAVILVDSGRLGGDLHVRRVRSAPGWTVFAVISIDSDRLGGDLRVRRGRPGPDRRSFWSIRSVGRRSPGTERTVRTGLAPRGAADRRPERLGHRRRTVSVSSEGRAPVFAAGNVPSRRTNPTHTQMKLEESKPRRILRCVFGCGWLGSHIHWSCLDSTVVDHQKPPAHTYSQRVYSSVSWCGSGRFCSLLDAFFGS